MSRAVPTFEIVFAALADEKLWFDLRTDEPRVKRYIHRERERFERLSTTDGRLDDVLQVEPECARDMIDRALVRVMTRGGWREEPADPAVLARLAEVRRRPAEALAALETGDFAFRESGRPDGSRRISVVASGASLKLEVGGDDRVRRLSLASPQTSPQHRIMGLILHDPAAILEPISPALRAEIDAKSDVARYPALLREAALAIRLNETPDSPAPDLIWRGGVYLLECYGLEEVLSVARLAAILADRHGYGCEFFAVAPPPPPPPRPPENPDDPVAKMAALSKARGYAGAGAELDATEGYRRMTALAPEARRVFEFLCCLGAHARIQFELAAIGVLGPLRDLEGALATLVESGLIAGRGMALNEELAEKVCAEQPELARKVAREMNGFWH